MSIVYLRYYVYWWNPTTYLSFFSFTHGFVESNVYKWYHYAYPKLFIEWSFEVSAEMQCRSEFPEIDYFLFMKDEKNFPFRESSSLIVYLLTHKGMILFLHDFVYEKNFIWNRILIFFCAFYFPVGLEIWTMRIDIKQTSFNGKYLTA